MWLVRRSPLEVTRAARAGERLAIRTWVEDSRRVRSHRRYAVHGADGVPVLEALTDWVYVDVESGRPRRVPREFETAFAAGTRREREAWRAPPAPPGPARGPHRVRARAGGSIGHAKQPRSLHLPAQAGRVRGGGVAGGGRPAGGGGVAGQRAAAGVRGVPAARRAGRLVEAVAAIRAAGGAAEAAVTDLRDEAQVERLIDGAVARYGRLDALVNNAAVGHIRPVAEGRSEEWRGPPPTHTPRPPGAFRAARPPQPPRGAGGNL